MKARVAYSSFMRWQRQKREFRRLIEESEQMWRDSQRMKRELGMLLSGKTTESNTRSDLHNRRPYRDPNAQPLGSKTNQCRCTSTNWHSSASHIRTKGGATGSELVRWLIALSHTAFSGSLDVQPSGLKVTTEPSLCRQVKLKFTTVHS